MTKLPFIALGFGLCLLAQAALVAITPPPAQAGRQYQEPPEVAQMVALMATMPLNILTTETGTQPVPRPSAKPDEIAMLINRGN